MAAASPASAEPLGHVSEGAPALFLNGTCSIAPLRAKIRKPIPLSKSAIPTTIPKSEIALPV
jgi:hypothetical protein